MGRKQFCLPSLVISAVAFILLVLASISTPLVSHVDGVFYVAQASNLNGTVVDITQNANTNRDLSAIRGGIWGYCSKSVDDSSYSYCSSSNHNWQLNLRTTANASDNTPQSTVDLGASWTRGMVVTVVALVFTAVGFFLSFPPHLPVQLLASFTLLLSMLLSLIAFICMLVFFLYFRNRVHKVAPDASIKPGAGFYLVLVSIPLLFVSALTVCCGWRSDRSERGAGGTGYGSTTYGAGAGGGGFMGRFRRRGKGAAGGDDYSYGAREDGAYANGTGQTKDNIPLTSRQRVLEAFGRS